MPKKQKILWSQSSESMPAYHEAKHKAQIKANETGLDVLLEANDLMRCYSSRLLPCPRNRSGSELRGEVVRPTTWTASYEKYLNG